MEAGPRCKRCRETIGVYEPIVVVRAGQPVRTSRAAEPETPLEDEPCFHADCFAELQGGAS